jgi:hypothetical protein
MRSTIAHDVRAAALSARHLSARDVLDASGG